MTKKKSPKKMMNDLNIVAHNRMAGLMESGEDEDYFLEHGHRRAKGHAPQRIENIAEDLISVAKRIYDYRIAVAMGEKPKEALNRGMVEYQQYIIDLVEPMIKEYQQARNINANSAGEVIKLLSKGKVTPKEATELLTVVGKTIEVEEKELKKMLQNELLKNVEVSNNG